MARRFAFDSLTNRRIFIEIAAGINGISTITPGFTLYPRKALPGGGAAIRRVDFADLR